MTRNRAVFLTLSLALVLPIATATYLAASSAKKNTSEDSLFKYLSVFTEVLGLVRQSYVDHTDLDELMAASLDGVTDALDPFSLYVPAKSIESYEAVRKVGNRRSGLWLLKQDGVVFAAAVQANSPAAEAGVQQGDVIGKINGEATRLMPLWRVQQTLAGEVGSKVELNLLRFGDRIETTLELAEFSSPAPALRDEEGQAVLRISNFDAATVLAVKLALAQAVQENRRGLLIDLRGVAGGDSLVAYEVAGLFTQGELGKLVHRDEAIQTFTAENKPLWKGRLVVLTDRGSVGPSEILAAILHEKLAAKLVGKRTFGYAGRMGQKDLSTGGRLIYTDAFFTGPDGEPLREGLVPDLRVDDRSRTLAEVDEEINDLILERGLELLADEDEESEPVKKAA